MLTYDLTKSRGLKLDQLIGYIASGLNMTFAPSTVFRGYSSLRCSELTYSKSSEGETFTCDGLKITVKKVENNHEVDVGDVAKIISSTIKYGFVTTSGGMYEFFILN